MITSFSASVVSGSGRGRTIGTPTINLDPAALATIGREGIYAAWAILDAVRMPAVVHAGARPVFDDTPSVEVHLLCPPPATIPGIVAVELVDYIREVRNFASVDDLTAEIAHDIASARATLDLDVA